MSRNKSLAKGYDVVGFIDALAHRNSEALSFIPRPMLQHYVESERVLMATENGELCGYLIHGNGGRWCRIYQACIQYDVRRREHGFRLVADLIRKAACAGFVGVSLWCADDLEANGFWRAAGFTFFGQREGGKRRGRKHNRWIFRIQPVLFSEDEAASAQIANIPRPLAELANHIARVFKP